MYSKLWFYLVFFQVDFAECDESFKSESFCDEKDELCWSKAGSTASVDSGYNWLLDSDFGENSKSTQFIYKFIAAQIFLFSVSGKKGKCRNHTLNV